MVGLSWSVVGMVGLWLGRDGLGWVELVCGWVGLVCG